MPRATPPGIMWSACATSPMARLYLRGRHPDGQRRHWRHQRPPELEGPLSIGARQTGSGTPYDSQLDGSLTMWRSITTPSLDPGRSSLHQRRRSACHRPTAQRRHYQRKRDGGHDGVGHRHNPLSYQWYDNTGSPIPTGTSATWCCPVCCRVRPAITMSRWLTFTLPRRCTGKSLPAHRQRRFALPRRGFAAAVLHRLCHRQFTYTVVSTGPRRSLMSGPGTGRPSPARRVPFIPSPPWWAPTCMRSPFRMRRT